MTLERGWESGVPVAGHHSVDDTLEGRVGCAEGRQLPEQSLQDRGRHGKDAVEGCPGGCPGENRAPIAPGLDTGGPSRAKGGNHRGECLAHIVDGAGREGGEGRDHGFPVAQGAIEGGTAGAIMEGRAPSGTQRWKGICEDALDVANGGNGGRGPGQVFTRERGQGRFDGGAVGGARSGER